MKKIIVLLSIAFCLCLLGCNRAAGSGSNMAENLSKEEYNYEYDRPFYSTPDDFMTIDGVFDEEEWSDCVWMQTTQYDVTYKITTLFTEKGIYVAAYAEDPNIIFRGRNNFINNSSFEIQIVKENTPVYTRANRWRQNFMNDYMFHADSKTCRSYRERNFNGAVKCVGEPNSGNTTSLSYEMFMGWDQMHFNKSELEPETGMPKSVRIWCQYIRVDKNNSADTRYISPFLMDYGIYPSYYEYGPKGIINRPDNGVIGSAVKGTTCTDRWIMNPETGEAKVDLYQTQHIWFNHDVYGNEISRPTSFIAEAKVTADTTNYTSGQATFGIMTIHDMWSMVTYGVNMSNLINGKTVTLESIEGIDSSYWVGQLSMVKTMATNYADNSIYLRLVKINGYYYYFYKAPSDAEYTYAGYEYFYKNDGEVDVGLFTNCPSTVSEYKVIDFTGNESQLEKELTKSVYFIDSDDASGGSIEVSDNVIRKGDALKVILTPNNGYVLNQLTVNGENKFDEYRLNNGVLEFVPTSDVAIKAKFVRIPVEYCENVEFTVVDSENVAVANADFVIRNTNPLLSKTGVTSGKGIIKTVIPKKGNFEINGVTYDCDGEYTLNLTKKTFIDKTYEFTLTGEISETIVMKDTLWGKKTSINGKNIADAYGSLEYDEETDSYYTFGGGVRQYYSNTFNANGNYVYRATITTKPTQGTINPVVGMVITSGTSTSTLNLKSAWWEQNNLCIEINGKEISVSGFKHRLNNNNGSSQITVIVARLNDVLYIYDEDGNLAVTLDKIGVHPQGSRQIKNNSGLAYVQSQIKEFFKNGTENMCGPLVIDGKNARIDFNISASFTGVEDFVTGGRITIESGLNYESEKPIASYVKGETVRLFVKGSADKIVTALKLSYNGNTTVINGNYDILIGKTEFNFAHEYGAVSVALETAVDCDEVTGTLSGFTDYSKVLSVLDGVAKGAYYGLIKAGGAFNFSVPKGALGIAFIEGDKVAVVNKADTSTLKNLSVGLVKNDATPGSLTLNGKEISSKADLTFETYRKIALGEKFAIASSLDSKEFGSAERREYVALLTASAKAGDMSVTDVLSASIAYGKAGLAITDGEKMISVQLGAGGEYGKLFVDYGAFGGEGERFNLNKHVATYTGTGVTSHNLNGKDWSLKIIKTDNGIEILLNDVSFGTITNETLGEEFFVSKREYCFGLVSANLAGDIYNLVTLG